MRRTVVLELPDISWDIERLGTDPPTDGPSPAPTTSPTSWPTTDPTPEPTASPTASNPTPGQASSDQASILLTAQPTPAPSPAPTAPAISTPAPTDGSTPYPTTASPVSPAARTVYSCPPPAPKTVSARDADGSDVTFEIPPPISTIRIAYDFQVQLMHDAKEEDMDTLLPEIEGRLEDSLGSYMKSNTANGEDSSSCDGFHVQDFRRRRLNYDGIVLMLEADRKQNTLRQREARADVGEDVPTRIIGISSAEDLTVERNRDCVPRNDNCYVVHGEMDCTYVGFNEAGVKSSISRVVKEEMASSEGSDGQEYTIQYLNNWETAASDGGTQTATTPSALNSIMNTLSDAIPTSAEGFQPTPYGMAILVALGAAFMAVVYVLFIKSEAPAKVQHSMNERKEKKSAKRKALGEKDDEKNKTLQDTSYSYDLESVAITGAESGMDGEDGVEVRSMRSFGSSAKVGVGSVVSGMDGSRDSGKTKKMSNKSGNAMSHSGMQNLTSLMEEETDDDESGIGDAQGSPLAGIFMRSNSGSSNSSRGGRRGGETPLVDRIPSSARGSPDSTAVYQLPAISEADGIPPPMNDTPHIAHNSGANMPFHHQMKSSRRRNHKSDDETDEQYEV